MARVLANPQTDFALLSRLVAFDTASGASNIDIAEFIVESLNLPGVQVFRNYNFNRDKVNLVIRAGPDRNDQAGLTLCGHLDVVAADEPDWETPPFTLTDRGDRWVGRGSCDMKGFVALAIQALRRHADRRLTAPLVLLLTFDEELGTLGAQHFVKTWPAPIPIPKATWVGEPTELRVVRTHKGHLKMSIAVRGVSAHSAYPQLGRNAIASAARIVSRLFALGTEMLSERRNSSTLFPDSPSETLNVGWIKGGEAVNVVPDRCEVRIGIRLLPDSDVAALVDRVGEAVGSVADAREVDLRIDGISPALMTPESGPLYRFLCESAGQRESFSASYATDGGPLSQLGLECVVMGPGSISVAHKPNEWIPTAEFQQMPAILDRAIDAFCTS